MSSSVGGARWCCSKPVFVAGVRIVEFGTIRLKNKLTQPYTKFCPNRLLRCSGYTVMKYGIVNADLLLV